MKIDRLKIGDFHIGPDHPCFIIAEAGVNHNGNPDLARQLVDAAVDAKASAVKFQTFRPDNLLTSGTPKAQYQKDTTDTSETQLEMIRRLQLSAETHLELVRYCQSKNILFLSSPFDSESAALLEDLGVSAYKVPSGEITNLPLLAQIASYMKPMIVSTGMSYLSEVEDALRTIKRSGNQDVVLLQCVSNYPADPSDVNLYAMSTMASAFRVPVGYSDHTLGLEVSIAAVALGASVIEKHLTLDHNLTGPDHRSSLEPSEFVNLVKNIRNVEAALGSGVKAPADSEANTSSVARKFLVASEHLKAGSVLTRESIALKRSGSGMDPKALEYLIGRTTKVDIPADGIIDLEHLA